jgi:hypothetical protein
VATEQVRLVEELDEKLREAIAKLQSLPPSHAQQLAVQSLATALTWLDELRQQAQVESESQ